MNDFTLEQSLGLISSAAAAWLMVRASVAKHQLVTRGARPLRGVRSATHDGRMHMYGQAP
jgi:hypothetical protein